MYKRCFIIAEAGVNHNGDLEIAKQMIDVAAAAKVDAIKFQTFRADSLVCQNAIKAQYQLKSTNPSESQYKMLKKLELTDLMHKELITYCKDSKIKFMSTPFDLDSIELLQKYELNLYKIPSGEITNYPYLRKIASLGKKIILSTGMSSIEEVKDAIKILKEYGAADISLLHCNTQYPTPVEDVNLNAMKTLREQTGLEVGYSDHTEGIEIPIAAVAMGATIIEKHFTLDKNMEGPDQKASIEPNELICMVQSIRNVEQAFGNGIKKISDSERDNVFVVRKSIVANMSIKKGELFTETNITTKRPGTGISPMQWNYVIGKRACQDFERDEQIIL